jgi:hypothetical protein
MRNDMMPMCVLLTASFPLWAQRTGEERGELARVGQLDEVIAVREAANRTLRVENKLLQVEKLTTSLW